ncbi:hypothetical protein CK934_28160 [Chitinophaga sp. MD30]|nr:hypothetical protein CK934_28160 [Chitinophaga sp. MD30]
MQSGQQNLKLYNFYSVINIPFFIYLLRGFLVSKKMQRVLVVAMIVYPILALINIQFIQGPDIFNTNTYIPGCIILGLISIFYFKENIRSPKQQSLLNDPAFWITTAVLFFYTCTIPVYGLLNFLRNLPDYLYNSIYIFHTVLNVLLYLLFSISFLCNLSFRKSISQ